MSNFTLSEHSEEKLIGVHLDLVRVVEMAIEKTPEDFTVGEGVRSLERQTQLFLAGKSQTMNSRHLVGKDGFGHAVDLWCLKDGHVTWDAAQYKRLAKVVLACADQIGVPVEWGGNWLKFKDGPHFQLSKSRYP
jgi:peptidoglycan L-alanyl-D-glutamate endopeptidase CwlK